MTYCIQATKAVKECQTYSTKRHKMSFCSPTEITQEVCVVTDEKPGDVQLAQWTKNALDNWKAITRVEKPLILVPRYHCESYQYTFSSTGLDELNVDDKCSVLKSILNYFFA